MEKHNDTESISRLLEIMSRLRDPVSGCPWDLAQDFATIAPYTLEEAYEVADCIERRDLDALPDELGDLLLQVVFHAQIGADRALFDFDDVVASICDKMIRRHPHIFADGTAATSEEVSASWEQIKRREQPAARGLLDGVALALPALVRAQKLGKRAAGVGFDWPALPAVRAKLDEEIAELDVAVAGGAAEQVEAEVGDVLFTVVNLCRHLQVDAERALRRANDRFARRFGQVEREIAAQGGDWSEFTPEALDLLWARAKSAETS
jgi:nucleoside triphosphate diphosphatase